MQTSSELMVSKIVQQQWQARNLEEALAMVVV